MSIETKVADVINQEVIHAIKKLWNKEDFYLIWYYSGQIINNSTPLLLRRLEITKVLI